MQHIIRQEVKQGIKEAETVEKNEKLIENDNDIQSDHMSTISESCSSSFTDSDLSKNSNNQAANLKKSLHQIPEEANDLNEDNSV